jgi:type I restriction enzyme M protein
MANNLTEIKKRLWASADELKASSGLKSSEYSVPVLGLIFLRYADPRFAQAEKELASIGTGRGGIGQEDYQNKGVILVPRTRLAICPSSNVFGKGI